MPRIWKPLRKTALILVVAGLLWNLVEAGVAFWAASQSSSVALLAYGLDSVIEILAGGVLVWRLRNGARGIGSGVCRKERRRGC